MGIFNSGVGKRSRRYAQAMMGNNQSQLDQVTGTINTGASRAGKALGNAYTAGRGYLGTAFNQATGTIQGGQQAATDYLNQGFGNALERSDAGFAQGRNDLVAGRDAALGNQNQALGNTAAGYAEAMQALQARYGQSAEQLQGAVNTWDPIMASATKGMTAYDNAMGLNGAEGNAAALQGFQAGPGYTWQQQQATQGAQRAANRTGSASSGNALDAVTRLSSNLANQEWGGHLDRLQGYQGLGTTAAAGRAGALTNLGGLYQQQAGAESGLITDRTAANNSIYNNMSTINQTSGQNLAQNSQQQGTAAAGIYTDQGKTLATNATNYAQLLANLQTQYGQDRTNLRTSYGSSIAGLETGKAGALATAQNNYWNGNNQALGVALQGSNQQGAETASWGQGLIGLAGQVAGLGVSGGGTVGGNFLSSLFPKG